MSVKLLTKIFDSYCHETSYEEFDKEVLKLLRRIFSYYRDTIQFQIDLEFKKGRKKESFSFIGEPTTNGPLMKFEGKYNHDLISFNTIGKSIFKGYEYQDGNGQDTHIEKVILVEKDGESHEFSYKDISLNLNFTPEIKMKSPGRF